MDEEELKQRLNDLSIPDGEQSEDRAWQTVRTAFAEREPEAIEERRRPSRRSSMRIAAVLAAIASVVLIITPAGASVTGWVGDVFDGRDLDSSKVIRSIPGGGHLLVESARDTWITTSDGSSRRLGEFSDPTWSPRGLFVAAVAGDQLVALEPDGDVRWTLARPGGVSRPAWKSPDGFRIAYLEGSKLRVVAGDGTGDRLAAQNVAPVQPAWRPGPENMLAFARRDGAVEFIQTDTGERLASAQLGSPAVGLRWSGDGTHLLAWNDRQVRLLAPDGSTRWQHRPASGRSIDSAAIEPGTAHRVVILEGGERTSVVLAGPGNKKSVLFTAPGDLENPVWSPDGAWLNIGWPEADQWLFLHGRNLGRIDVVTDVSEQFSPGATDPIPFPRVRGWCCQR